MLRTAAKWGVIERVPWRDWTNDVFFDRMRAQTIQTFTHLDRLKDDARHLSTRLAAAAVFSANDPWTGNGWLFEFVRHADAANLQEWALSFGRIMESLAPEAAAQLWRRWLRRYCHQRGLGVPRAFEDREKGRNGPVADRAQGRARRSSQYVRRGQRDAINTGALHTLSPARIPPGRLERRNNGPLPSGAPQSSTIPRSLLRRGFRYGK